MHAPVSGLAVIALVAATTCGRGNDPRNYTSPLCEAFASYRVDRFDRCVPPSLLIHVGDVQGSDPSSAFSDPLSTVCGVTLSSNPGLLVVASRPPVDWRSSTGAHVRATNVSLTSLPGLDDALVDRARAASTRSDANAVTQLRQCQLRLCDDSAWMVQSIVSANAETVGESSPSETGERRPMDGLEPVVARVWPARRLVSQFCAQSIEVPDGGTSITPSRYCGASEIECPPYFQCETGRCVLNLRQAWDVAQFPAMPTTPWQFGYRDSAEGFPGIVPFDSYTEHRGNLSRFASSLGLDPNVRYWPRAQVGPYGENPNSAAFHPGPSGQWSIVRFVPPVAGQYRFDLRLDSPTATTTVRVDWFPSASPSTPRSISLDVVPAVVAARQLLINTNANSAVDFAVGSPNNDYSSDTTNISLEAEFVSPLE